MTAREIIESHLGRKLPPVEDMSPDERQAVLMLGLAMLRGITS